MNTRLIALIAILIVSGSSFVQAQDFRGGIKAGVNLAQLDGQKWDGGYKANLVGGLYLALNGRRAGIQIEGLFSQSQYVTGTGFKDIGSQYFNNFADSLKIGKFRVNYFNIPVLFQLRFSKVWLQAGPQYSGIVSVNDLNGLLKDASRLFKNGQISGVLGLNVDVTKNLTCNIRYVIGLSDVNNTPITESWRQKNIQFTLGFGF